MSKTILWAFAISAVVCIISGAVLITEGIWLGWFLILNTVVVGFLLAWAARDKHKAG